MAEMNVIAITSGKGGTGKSSICAGLGYSLSKQGKRTLIIELDFGLRCMDIIFGVKDQIKYDLGDVLEGKCKDIQEAIVPVKMSTNLNILCAPENPFMVVTADQIADICQQVKKYYDYIIIDTGAGINSHVFDIVEQSNMILVVTTPDPICVRDARMMSDEFYKRGNQHQRLLINKVSRRMLKTGIINDLDEIIDNVGVQLIGIIPEDLELIAATGKGAPIPYGAASLLAFDSISRRIQGQDVPLTLKFK